MSEAKLQVGQGSLWKGYLRPIKGVKGIVQVYKASLRSPLGPSPLVMVLDQEGLPVSRLL